MIEIFEAANVISQLPNQSQKFLQLFLDKIIISFREILCENFNVYCKTSQRLMTSSNSQTWNLHTLKTYFLSDNKKLLINEKHT